MGKRRKEGDAAESASKRKKLDATPLEVEFNATTFGYVVKEENTGTVHVDYRFPKEEVQTFLNDFQEDMFHNAIVSALQCSSARVEPTEMIYLGDIIQKSMAQFTALKWQQLDNARNGIIPFDTHNNQECDHRTAVHITHAKYPMHANAGLPLILTYLTHISVNEWETRRNSHVDAFYKHNPMFAGINFDALRRGNYYGATSILPPTIKMAIFICKFTLDYLCSLRQVSKTFKHVIDSHCSFLPVMIMHQCGLIPMANAIRSTQLSFNLREYIQKASAPLLQRQAYENRFKPHQKLLKYSGKKVGTQLHFYRLQYCLTNPNISFIAHVRWFNNSFLQELNSLEHLAKMKLMMGCSTASYTNARVTAELSLRRIHNLSIKDDSFVNLLETMVEHNKRHAFRPYTLYTDRNIPFSDYDHPEDEDNTISDITEHSYLHEAFAVTPKPSAFETRNEFIRPVKMESLSMFLLVSDNLATDRHKWPYNLHPLSHGVTAPKNHLFCFSHIAEKYVVYPPWIYYSKQSLTNILVSKFKDLNMDTFIPGTFKTTFLDSNVQTRIQNFNKLFLIGLPMDYLFDEKAPDQKDMVFDLTKEDDIHGRSPESIAKTQFAGSYVTFFLKLMHSRFVRPM